MAITYKVFIASSMYLEEERNLVERILEEQSDSNLIFQAYRHEKKGDNNIQVNSDTQRDVIDPEIIRSDAFLMIVHDWIRPITEHEFRIAFNAQNIKHKYILHCDCDHKEDGTCIEEERSWKDFRNDPLNGIIKQYEYQYSFCKGSFDRENSLREKVILCCKNMKASLLSFYNANEIDYDQVIPNEQKGTRTISGERNMRAIANHTHIKRPEIEIPLIEVLQNNKKFIIITGQSTSGKTYAVCHAIKQLPVDERLKVLFFNKDTPSEEFERLRNCHLNPTNKYILFFDDIQDVLYDEHGYKKDEEIIKFLQTLLIRENSNCKIIATSYEHPDVILKRIIPVWNNEMRKKYVKTMFIEPINDNDWEIYSRRLLCGGFIKKNQIKNLRTIGALFIDLDRLQAIYNGNVGEYRDDADLEIIRIHQICHSLKCIWSWKKRYRRDLNLLLSFLQFTFPHQWEGKNIEYLEQIIQTHLKQLAGVKVSDHTLEIEDVVVTDIFHYIPKEYFHFKNHELSNEECMTKLVLKYLYFKNRDTLYSALTKFIVRLSFTIDKKYIPIVRGLIIELSEAAICDSSNLYKNEECDKKGTDWVSAFLSRCIYYANSEELALTIWSSARKKGKIIDPTIGILQRYNDSLSPLKQNDVKNFGTLKKEINNRLNSLYEQYDTFYDYCIGTKNVNLLRELLRFKSDVKVAMEYYKILDFHINHNNNYFSMETKRNNLLDIFEDDEEVENNMQSNIPCLIEYNHRLFCQAMFSVCKSWQEVESLILFLSENQKDELLFPQESCNQIKKILFEFVSTKTWRRLTRLWSITELLKMRDAILAIEVDINDQLHFLNKTETLNDVLKQLPWEEADWLWRKMGLNRDGYSLNYMLTKAKKKGFFPEAILKFGEYFAIIKQNEFLKDYNRISHQNINALLDTANSKKDLDACENVFREYNIIGENEDFLDLEDEYRTGIILKYQPMAYVEDILKKQLKTRKDKGIETSRDTNTLITYILRAKATKKKSAYMNAYNYIFGKCDFVTKQEQENLQNNACALAEMINKVENVIDGKHARDFFESTNQWNGELLGNEDALLLNRVLDNDYIYPEYEDKIKAIHLKESQGFIVKKNDYTKKHLNYYKKYISKDILLPIDKTISEIKSDNIKLKSRIIERLLLSISSKQDFVNIMSFLHSIPKGNKINLNILHLHAIIVRLGRLDIQIKFLKQNNPEESKRLRNEWFQIYEESFKYFSLWEKIINKKDEQTYLRYRFYLKLKFSIDKSNILKIRKYGDIAINEPFLFCWTLLYWYYESNGELKSYISGHKSQIVYKIRHFNETLREHYPNYNVVFVSEYPQYIVDYCNIKGKYKYPKRMLNIIMTIK